jgi:hypothetical protein
MTIRLLFRAHCSVSGATGRIPGFRVVDDSAWTQCNVQALLVRGWHASKLVRTLYTS